MVEASLKRCTARRQRCQQRVGASSTVRAGDAGRRRRCGSSSSTRPPPAWRCRVPSKLAALAAGVSTLALQRHGLGQTVVARRVGARGGRHRHPGRPAAVQTAAPCALAEQLLRVAAGLHDRQLGFAQHQQHTVRLHRAGKVNQLTLAVGEVGMAEVGHLEIHRRSHECLNPPRRDRCRTGPVAANGASGRPQTARGARRLPATGRRRGAGPARSGDVR